MKYVCPAILTAEENGGYSVDFPDIPNCFAAGNSLSESLENAADVLSLVLFGKEKRGEPIPEFSSIDHLPGKATYILADTDNYQRDHLCRAVKKTLTIPRWLNHLAEEANLPFSYLLQEALKEKLCVYSLDEYLSNKGRK